MEEKKDDTGQKELEARRWIEGIIKETIEQSKHGKAKTESPFIRVRDKITALVLCPRDINRIIGLKYRGINEWQKRQIKMGRRSRKSRFSWHYFSIEDVMRLAIVQTIHHLGVPLLRLKSWMAQLNLIDSVLYHFSIGQTTALYFDLHDMWKILYPSPQGHQELLGDLLDSKRPVIFFPLNNLMKDVLSKSGRSDFQAIFDEGTNEVRYLVDGDMVQIERFERPDRREG